MISGAATTGEPQAKGLSFRQYIKILRRLRGDQVVEDMLTRMPKDLSEKLRTGQIIASSWYPLEWYKAFYPALRQVTPVGAEFSRTIGHESVREDLSGVYKIFLKIVSPEFVLSAAPRIFGVYYDTGRMEVVEKAPKRAVARWSGCKGFNRDIWQENFGGAEAALEAAGAKHVRTHLVGGGGDDDHWAELRAHWL